MTRRPVSLPPLPWSPLALPDDPAEARRLARAADRARRDLDASRRAEGLARPALAAVRVEDPARDPRTGAPLGGEVEVRRAALPRCVANMPESRRAAFEVFAEVAESVEAGGARTPDGDRAGGAGPSPAGAGLSRQFHALADADRLRRLEDAADPRAALALPGPSGRVAFPILAALRALALEGRTLAQVLAAAGASTSRRNEIRARDALFAALGRIAVAAGLEPEPKPEVGPAEK